MAHRRVLSLSVESLALLGAALPISAAAVHAEHVSGELVGVLTRPRAYAAVVVGPAAGRAPREVRSVVCAGRPRGLAEWFIGLVEGNRVRLRSRSGHAELVLHLRSDAAQGRLRAGSLPFRSLQVRAGTGGAGLYTLNLTGTGRWQGTSQSGVELRGRTLAGGRAVGTLRPPGGRARPYRLSLVGAPPRAGRYLAIVLPGQGIRACPSGILNGASAGGSWMAHFLG